MISNFDLFEFNPFIIREEPDEMRKRILALHVAWKLSPRDYLQLKITPAELGQEKSPGLHGKQT
ncbi:hypothetical protein C5S39_00190 [Candidatus Methanophagaceae archaeon]|nr:hypothetical protein C5S39_00190 [Methanophagales archaeon]